MSTNHIEIKYGQNTVIVVVCDHFNKITRNDFDNNQQANHYVENLPGDYYVADSRNILWRGYVREFRKLQACNHHESQS
jgi:hypothetical protein